MNQYDVFTYCASALIGFGVYLALRGRQKFNDQASYTIVLMLFFLLGAVLLIANGRNNDRERQAQAIEKRLDAIEGYMTPEHRAAVNEDVIEEIYQNVRDLRDRVDQIAPLPPAEKP